MNILKELEFRLISEAIQSVTKRVRTVWNFVRLSSILELKITHKLILHLPTRLLYLLHWIESFQVAFFLLLIQKLYQYWNGKSSNRFSFNISCATMWEICDWSFWKSMWQFQQFFPKFNGDLQPKDFKEFIYLFIFALFFNFWQANITYH